MVSRSGAGNLLVNRANPEAREDRIKEIFPGPQTGLYVVCCNRGSQRKLFNYQVRAEGKPNTQQSRAEKGFVFKTFDLNCSTKHVHSVLSVRCFTIEVQMPVFDIF